MQSFTKTEISWIIVEFEKLAKNYEMQIDDAPTHAEANMLRLRTEQYRDISKRMRTALRKGAKRLEIK